MVKKNQVRLSLICHGFVIKKESSDDPAFRFSTTAFHVKKGIRIVISARNGQKHHQRGLGRQYNKRQVEVEIVNNKGLTPLGINSPVIVGRLCEIEKILQKVDKGVYKSDE